MYILTILLLWHKLDLVRLGLEVIFQRHCLGAAEEVQHDDAAHVHLGDEKLVVWVRIKIHHAKNHHTKNC